jgi:hypothetical protein
MSLSLVHISNKYVSHKHLYHHVLTLLVAQIDYIYTKQKCAKLHEVFLLWVQPGFFFRLHNVPHKECWSTKFQVLSWNLNKGMVIFKLKEKMIYDDDDDYYYYYYYY